MAVAKASERSGDLVGALTVADDDEVLVVFEKGNIVRSRVDEVRLTSRNTMGVMFAKPSKRTGEVVAIARNPEREVEEELEAAAEAESGAAADTGTDRTDPTGAQEDAVASAPERSEDETGGQQ